MYPDATAAVVTPDGETEEFDILAGVLQGDLLAPYLFIIALDYVRWKATEAMEEKLGFVITPKKLRRAPPVILWDFKFAGDICLLS